MIKVTSKMFSSQLIGSKIPDWVAPGSTPGNYHSYQFLIEPIQKPPLVDFHCIAHKYWVSNHWIQNHLRVTASEAFIWKKINNDCWKASESDLIIHEFFQNIRKAPIVSDWVQSPAVSFRAHVLIAIFISCSLQ